VKVLTIVADDVRWRLVVADETTNAVVKANLGKTVVVTGTLSTTAPPSFPPGAPPLPTVLGVETIRAAE
jgi:hypothetical protein